MSKGGISVVHWNISRKDQIKIRGIKRYEDELYNNLRKIGVNVRRIQRTTITPLAYFKDYKFTDEDIVHGTTQEIANITLIKHIPRFVLTIHDLAVLNTNKLFPGFDISHKMQYLFIKKAIQKVNKIVTVSKFWKKEIVRLTDVDENKISIVYPGINHEVFKPMPDVAKSSFILSFVKVHDVVKIYREFRKKESKKYKLVLIGEVSPEDMPRIAHRDIIPMGYISDEELSRLYNEAGLLLYPTKYMGFDYPLFEAMACGCPVITSNMSDVPELLGDAGLKLDPYDIDAIIKAMHEVLTNEGLRQEMVKKGFDQVKRYSWERYAKEILKIYEKVYEETK